MPANSLSFAQLMVRLRRHVADHPEDTEADYWLGVAETGGPHAVPRGLLRKFRLRQVVSFVDLDAEAFEVLATPPPPAPDLALAPMPRHPEMHYPGTPEKIEIKA